jgi:hypothetical protein
MSHALTHEIHRVLAGRGSPANGHAPALRKTSRTCIAGLPLFEIAFGPRRSRGEAHGHAKAWIAIGDQATGALAIGGLAQGLVAVGGLSQGLIAVGGCTFGLFAALGGVAVGGLAIGGLALGGITRGGVAMGGLSARGRQAVSP